ncbi:hypothetical protein V1477_002990 [Vespula maculifrons]|uniref:Uncharacterized protein n=1 Tax=Vespula maculifrons TaxID=7453 RepID=A0ABD2CW41_VESMC
MEMLVVTPIFRVLQITIENDEGHDKILGVFANNFSDMSSESEDIDHCKDDIESERSEVDCSDVVKALTVVMI